LKQRRSLVEKTEVLYNLDLAKVFDKNIDLTYAVPLLKLNKNQNFRRENQLDNKKIVLIHAGYGGSSEGNLTLNQYLEIAHFLSKMDTIQVVWTFGPDDAQIQHKIQNLISPQDRIYQPPTVLDFCHLIADSALIISTSTGPMHLAGALNINTLSFFGDNLFASPRRWATVSDKNKQYNFPINNIELEAIKQTLLKIVC
jgi:ADP-heptose:LPS heptosyltransferase